MKNVCMFHKAYDRGPMYKRHVNCISDSLKKILIFRKHSYIHTHAHSYTYIPLSNTHTHIYIYIYIDTYTREIHILLYAITTPRSD